MTMTQAPTALIAAFGYSCLALRLRIDANSHTGGSTAKSSPRNLSKGRISEGNCQGSKKAAQPQVQGRGNQRSPRRTITRTI